MDGWTLHWLEAEGAFGPWRPRIEAEVAAGYAAVASLVPPPRLDIIAQRGTGFGIPELGMVGTPIGRAASACRSTPAFGASLVAGALPRMVPHEVHHCLRMALRRFGPDLPRRGR